MMSVSVISLVEIVYGCPVISKLMFPREDRKDKGEDLTKTSTIITIPYLINKCCLYNAVSFLF